jgi:LysM repeat protein
LARLNGLSDPGLVLAGQTLRLGEGSSASSASASEGRLPLAVGSGAAVSGGRYRVQPGDTLSEVALRLGISAQALAQANGVVDPDRLIAGRALVVPGP